MRCARRALPRKTTLNCKVVAVISTKLLGILRFELVYQARSFWLWLIVVVLLVLDFLMTRDGSLSEVLYVDFFINSPFAIAKTTVFGSLVWLLVAGPSPAERARGTWRQGCIRSPTLPPSARSTTLAGDFSPPSFSTR